MRLWSVVACVRTFVAAVATMGPEARDLTLGQLRADLSHEMAAKLARLSGILEEWRGGRIQENDLVDTITILNDIDKLHLRHARIAVATMSSFAQLTRVISTVQHLRAACAQALRPGAATPRGIDRAASLLRDLNGESRQLTEMLSRRYAVRFSDLVNLAVDEIRREHAIGQDVGVPMVVDDAESGVPTWVPRSDAPGWVDIIRNLVRNAIQAVQEHRGEPGDRAEADARCVTIRMRPHRGPGGACVEIIDDGVGMTPEQVAEMWHDGIGRHGEGHGHGLTRDKRAFVEQRADLEVRSIARVGTSVRVELRPRDITIRLPHRWAAPPITVPVAALCLLALLAIWQQRHLDMVSVSVTDEWLVNAIDRRGRVIWHKAMPERVAPNYRSIIMTASPVEDVPTPQLVTLGPDGRPMVVLSTFAARGPGLVIAYDNDGTEHWSHRLAWTAPRVANGSNLISAFQAESMWNLPRQRAIILNVRDRNWSSTSIQFLDSGGNPLGEYLHPGHLEFVASADFDGDGRIEVLLNGKNNDAAHNTPFWPGENTPGAYAECLILLETPRIGGQAFPYRRWEGIGPALEEAYLLIPPLNGESFADPKLTQVVRADFSHVAGDGQPCVSVSVADGRIYRLDSRLRPLSCTVGDHTPAAKNPPENPAHRLVYLSEGRLEKIDISVGRGT